MSTRYTKTAATGAAIASLAAVLVVWTPSTWGASASTKPAKPPAKTVVSTQPATRPAPDRPLSRPAEITAKALEDARRRARASTQSRAAAFEAARRAARSKASPQIGTPAETTATPTAKNRFADRLRRRRESTQTPPPESTPVQAAAAKPQPTSKPVAAKAALPPPPPKPSAEERTYVLSFHKATWDEILNTFCRWSDLTIIDPYPRTPVNKITYINPRQMTYHEALHELNMLLMEHGPNYWMVREKNHLRLRRLSDWPKYIAAENRFDSIEAFNAAKLDDDAWAMVFYTPKSQEVGELITNILMTMPDNVIRVAPVGETSRLKMAGIAFYIRQFVRLAESPMFQPEAVEAAKLRKIKFYKIEHAQASSVQQVLERIVLPRRRTRISTTVDEADQVDMILEPMSNTIIVKAKEENHREIDQMIKRIEESELTGDATTTFIKLQHARAEDLATMLNPLLRQQAAMKPSFDRRRSQREQVYLQADPTSNSLIVLANKEGLARVKELIERLDVESPETQYRRIVLKNAKADQIYPVVNSVVQSRQMRRGRRSPGQQLQVISDPQGNALYVMGNPKDIEYVEKLVAEIDAEDVERTKAHIIKLEKARPSVVAQGLQAIFGQTGRSRRGSPLGSFRVLPDDTTKVLVVICLDKDWKEIQPQIEQFDQEAVSLDPVMRTVEIQHGDAEDIANTLNNALRGRIGRASVVIGADRKTNMLFITTMEPAFEQVESLVKKLDVAGKEGKLEVIPLANANASEVANLIMQMFAAQRGSRRFGGGGTGPVVIPDPISNSLVVRATKSDLAEIEIQAMRIDDAAKDDAHKPTIIPLEYAEPSQVASLCEAMFVRRTGRRSAEQKTFFYPTRTGLVVRAPAQQMNEIKSFIQALDSPESENVEIKTVQLPGQDVEQIATILGRMFSAEQRRRGPAGAMSFMPNPSADMLVITAPKKRFEEIDKVIKQYTEGVKIAAASMKVFELKNARVDEVAELLDQMLGALGRRGRRAGARQVEILRDLRQNKLIVFAPDSVLKQADEMIKQLDVPLGEDAGGVKWIPLEHTDASYVASTLNQLWNQKQRRGRPKFRTMPVQIWPEAITNSVLVNAPADEFKEIEKLAKDLDAKALVSTTQPTIIPMQYVEPAYVISMCEQMFLPQVSKGVGRRRTVDAQSISFIAMKDGVMVRAPQTRLKAIQEFIKQLDSPGQARLEVKRFQLKKMDVQTLYTTLTQVFEKIKLQRDEPRPSFVVDAPNETVTVTCWSSRLPDIEKVIEDFKKAESQKEQPVRELIEVKFTRASYAASTLDSMLRRHLGNRAARLGSRLSIGVEDRQNKVEILAPPDVMADAKKILAEIDVKLTGATATQSIEGLREVQWIPVENVDASSAASTVNQIWEASTPVQQKNENRPQIRIWPEPITNSILVANAYGKDFETIQAITKKVDEQSIQNPNKPVMIKLEYATPGEVASMISALFIPPGRRADRKVAISTVSGGIVVRAPKVQLKEIQDFIQSYDKPEATGLKIRTFYLPQTNVSELASTLNQIFAQKKRRRNEPGWSFMPNTSADMLMVLAPETRMKEIEDVVKEYETNVQKTSSKMQMFELKHTRAAYVVSVLNELLREKLRRTRGRGAVNQLQISAESRQNKVVVFAPDDVMKQVEEMIKQVDIELADDAEEIKWIEILNADASEVASTLNNFFIQKKSYRRRQDSATIREAKIWPEMTTNSILVSAPQKEFEEIAKLAKKIDDEYAAKGLERVKITPKYVSVGQIQNMIQQLFYSRTRRRDVRYQREQIRIIQAGSYSFYLEAPKDKLAEVKKLIEEMDVEGENAPIIKTYKMGNVDVRRLAQALSQTTGGVGSYIPDARRGALIVSAPKHQFDRIEKAMEQLKADVEEEEAQFEVLTLKHARPSEAYSRLNQLISMQLSRRRSRRDRELVLSMYPDDANNRLYVYAGVEEMLLVRKMLEQLDVPGLAAEAVLHTLPLKRTDCEYMAGKIQQVFTPDELKRRRVRHGKTSQDTIPVRVVPEPQTNTLLITCAEEDFREVELFVAQLEDAYTEKEKALELITPKYVSQGQLMAAINAIYNPPPRRGERYKRHSDIRAIPASGSSFYLEAPKDKMVELKKLIADLDVEDKNRPVVRTYKMRGLDVRQLVRLLQSTMAGKGSFMADPEMGLVIISAPEYRFDQIEEMMTKLQDDIEETKQQFEVLELKFARPSDVYGRLSQLVSMQMSQRRSRRGQGVQLSLMPDDNNNRLFIYAGDEEMVLVKKMLEQLDVENLRKEAELHSISLKRTDCSYMATKIQQVFTPQELQRRHARRGKASRDVIPINVVPEPTTNTLLITCAEDDFHEIELFVAKIEDAFVEKEKVRELITPKFVSHAQLMATINAIYDPPARSGRRRKELPDIRAIPASGSSFFLEAPKDKMPELKALIERLDVEDENRPIVRTYRVGDVDVSQLARLLQQTMQGKGSFIADPYMGMLIVSAPEFRFKQIEETMNELKANIEETRQQFKVFPLKFAKATSIYGQLSQLVSTQVSRKRSRRGRSVELTIMPDSVLNRLFVYAGDEEMALVEKMLEQLDIEGVQPEQQVYSIELANADCSWAASMVQQMFTSEELRRRRRGKAGAVVAPLRVMADQMSNRLLVWASPQDYTDVEKFVKELDERAAHTKPERRILKPKFIRANELYSMIQTLFLQQRRKTGQRTRFIETFMVMSGADIILNGPKDRLEEIEQFVKTVDTEERAKMEIKTFDLPDVDISALVSTLNQLFAQDARKQRGNMLFIPDVQNNELMVSAPTSLMKDIEEIIEKKQAGAAKRTRALTMVEIEHADANYLASMLRPLIVERTRSRRGRYVQPEVTITPESRTNRLLIMAAESETKIAMDLIKELDTEAMGLRGQVRTIELNKADVSYVASTLQAIFSSRAQLRKSRTYTSTPVHIVAEVMTNRIFVAASEADYKEIEKLAREMDEAAELQGLQEEKIEVKYANPSQLVSVITQMFQPMRQRGRRQESDVRLNVVGPSILAQAPAKKMVEIKRWIKELDVEEFAETQTKFFTLEIARAREIQGIIQPMLQTKAQEIELRQGQKKRRGGSLMVLPDVRNNRLIITAPSQILTMAGELIKELDVEDPVWTGETVEIIELEKAEVSAVAQVLSQILRDREGQQARRPRKGAGSQYTGLAVTIVPDASSNCLILKGLPRELDRVKELIEQIEEKAVAGGVQFKLYRLEESDAEEVAEVAQQMVAQAGGARSKRNPVQITSNYMMNAIFVSGTSKQQAMVQKIIDVFEKPEMELDPETGEMVPVEREPFEFIRLKYSDAYDLLYDLETLIEQQFGEKKAPTIETLYGDSSVLMVSGKPNQISVVKKLVQMFEDKNKSKPPVTRTVDLGELDPDELKVSLERWGYLKETDAAEILGAEDIGEMVKEIGLQDARERIKEAEARKADPKRRKSRRRVPRRIGGTPFVPPSRMLSDLAAELDGIVYGAAATTKPAAEPKTITIRRQNRFAKTTTAPAKGKKAQPTTAPAKRHDPKVAPKPAKKEPAKSAVTSAKATAKKAKATAKKAKASKPKPAPTASVRETSSAKKAAPVSKPTVDLRRTTVTVKKPTVTVKKPTAAAKKPAAAKAAPKAKSAAKETTAASTTVKPAKNAAAPPKKSAPAAKAGDTSGKEDDDASGSQGEAQVKSGRFDLSARGSSTKGADEPEQKVSVIIDQKSGTVQIKGPERRVAEMEDLIYRLQEEIAPPLGKEMEFKVYEPKYLDVNVAAALLERIFNEPKAPTPAKPKQPAKKGAKEEDKEDARMSMMREMMRGRGIGGVTTGKERIRVVPDARTGYLIVVAKPETHRDIRDMLAKLDVPGLEPGNIEYFQLVNLSVTEVERGLKAILKLDSRQQRKLPALPKDQNKALQALQAQIQQIAGGTGGAYTSDQVTITSNVSTNTLVVMAPDEVIEIAEEYIEILEGEAGRIEIEAVALDTASATDVAQSMTKLYARGGAAVAGAGKAAGVAGASRLTISAAASSNTVFVRGPKDLRAEVIKRIKEIDAEASKEGKPFRIVLEQADAEVIAPKLQAAFATRRKRGQPSVQILGDNASNSLIVRAPENLREQVQELAKSLDVESVDIDIRVFPLEHANAVEVHQQMTQMTMQVLAQLRGKGKRNMKMDVFAAVPDPRTNSLIVTGGDATFAIVEKIKESIDVEPRGITEQVTIVYQLKQADASQVARAITQLYRSGRGSRYLKKSGLEPPQADFDTTTNTVMVRTTEKLHNMIKRDIIDKLDEFSVPKRVKDHTLVLKFAKSDDVAQILTDYFAQRQRQRRGRPNPTEYVAIVSEPDSNSLLIRCNEENMTVIQGLVEKMDREEVAGKASRRMKVIPLEYADPGSVSTAIRQTFVEGRRSRGGRIGQRDRVDAVAEYATNSLIVVASADNMEIVEKLVKDIDQEGTYTKQMHVVEVKNGEAQDIVQALTEMFVAGRSRRRGGRGDMPIKIVSPTGTNKIIVMSNETDFKKVAEAIKEMDVGTGGTAVRTVRLTNIAPEEAQTILTEFLRRPGRRGRHDPALLGDVRITVSPSAGSLILTARKERLDELETLIKKIDAQAAEESAGVRKIEIFRVLYANPWYTAQAISQAFQKRGRVAESDMVTATAEASTGSVIVSASEKNLVKIRKFVEELDTEDSGRRVTETVKLRFAQADEVAQQLNQIFQQTRRYTQRGQLPVTVTANARTNSLIVAARPNEIKEVKELIAMVDVEPDELLGRQLKSFILRYTDPGSMAQIINQAFRTRYGRQTPSDIVQATAEYGTSSVVVSATAENLRKVEKFITEMDREGTGTRKTHMVEVKNAEAEDVAQAVQQVFIQGRGRRGPTQPTVVNPPGTNRLLVRANEEDFQEIEALIKQLDEATGEGAGEEVRLVRLTHVAPEEAETILQEFLRKPGRRGRWDTSLRGNVRITPSISAGGLIMSARKEKLDELEALIKKFDVEAPEDAAGTRKIRIFPLEYANAYYTSQAINTAFRKRGRVAESEIVTATAEMSTGAIIVSASQKNMTKIEKFIEELDKEDKRGREVRVVTLTKARADDVAQTLTQIYRSRQRTQRGGEPVTITAEVGTNSLIIAAKKSEHEEVEKLLEKLDVDPTANDEIAIVTLEHVDASEALTIMESYLQRSGRRGRGGDLAGNTRLTASDSMNALVVSGKKENVQKVVEKVKELDQETVMADRAPKTIPLKSARATMLAPILEQIFVEPARQMARGRRAASAQQMIPTIIADESTNMLIVRARKSDYNLIEQMAKQLDREDVGGIIRIIPVPANMNVAELAGQVEQTINQGERYRAQKTGQRASQIAVGYDDRSNSLIVAGVAEQFDQVERLVKDLQAVKPAGEPVMRVIQLKNLEADDVRRVLDQMMERSGSRRRGRRY